MRVSPALGSIRPTRRDDQPRVVRTHRLRRAGAAPGWSCRCRRAGRGRRRRGSGVVDVHVEAGRVADDLGGDRRGRRDAPCRGRVGQRRHEVDDDRAATDRERRDGCGRASRSRCSRRGCPSRPRRSPGRSSPLQRRCRRDHRGSAPPPRRRAARRRTACATAAAAFPEPIVGPALPLASDGVSSASATIPSPAPSAAAFVLFLIFTTDLLRRVPPARTVPRRSDGRPALVASDQSTEASASIAVARAPSAAKS